MKLDCKVTWIDFCNGGIHSVTLKSNYIIAFLLFYLDHTKKCSILFIYLQGCMSKWNWYCHQQTGSTMKQVSGTLNTVLQNFYHIHHIISCKSFFNGSVAHTSKENVSQFLILPPLCTFASTLSLEQCYGTILVLTWKCRHQICQLLHLSFSAQRSFSSPWGVLD